MNRVFKTPHQVAIFIFLSLLFTFSTSAQRRNRNILPPNDATVTPFDYTNEYYQMNGVRPKIIIGRLNGADGLSVFDKSTNPDHSNVRVLVTLPAYDQNGNLVYWYPLGNLTSSGFTDDKPGFVARQTATLFPIYVFPGPKIEKPSYTFANNRQAPIIDDSWTMYMGKNLNSLGIRQLFFVNFTERAFTDEYSDIMKELGVRNGLATDDTPIIKTVDDIRMLLKYEMISLYSRTRTDQFYREQFIMSPIITDPTKGVIAKDAFIWMAQKDGNPLPTEEVFGVQFGCLQANGNWCK